MELPVRCILCIEKPMIHGQLELRPRNVSEVCVHFTGIREEFLFSYLAVPTGPKPRCHLQRLACLVRVLANWALIVTHELMKRSTLGRN